MMCSSGRVVGVRPVPAAPAQVIAHPLLGNADKRVIDGIDAMEADAQIRLLHDQQRGVAATDSQEIGTAEKHGVVAE